MAKKRGSKEYMKSWKGKKFSEEHKMNIIEGIKKKKKPASEIIEIFDEDGNLIFNFKKINNFKEPFIEKVFEEEKKVREIKRLSKHNYTPFLKNNHFAVFSNGKRRGVKYIIAPENFSSSEFPRRLIDTPYCYFEKDEKNFEARLIGKKYVGTWIKIKS